MLPMLDMYLAVPQCLSPYTPIFWNENAYPVAWGFINSYLIFPQSHFILSSGETWT